MDKRNQVIRDFCYAYTNWLYTRSFYAKQLPINILARMIPAKTGEAPNAPNDPMMAAFHLSLMHVIDTDNVKALCFLYVFFPYAKPEPIKTLAYKINANKDTVNEWAHSTAEAIFRQAKLQCDMYSLLKKEIAGFEL